MKKTKVMFVVLQLDAGGSERVMFDLARSLDPSQFEVYIAAFKGGVLEEPLREICKKLFFLLKKDGLDVSAMFHLARIVKDYEIDVVNSHHYMPCFYSFIGAKIFNRKKLIYTEHSVPEVESVAYSFHGKVFYWMLFWINAVVGVSLEVTDKFKARYKGHAEKFIAILNGVDLIKFKPKVRKEEVRRQLELGIDDFVVGTIANFRKVKNHACLLRAAARLKNSHPQLQLLFVGTGFPGDSENSEEDVCRLISDLGLQGRVTLAGYQENIPEILSALDAFCLPSFSEGLPVSLLEAMAAEVPVIGSEVDGITEVVTHEETGLLFPSNDEDALSLILDNIMKNPLVVKDYVANAYEYVASNHNSRLFVQKYSQLFRAN